MNRYEFFNLLLDLYKKTGQGIDRNLVARKVNTNFVDELVEEGKVIITHHSYSYLSSEDWIQPAGFYNTEADCNKLGNQLPLIFIRKFLKIENVLLNQDLNDKIENDPELKVEYFAWKEKNKELLDKFNNIEKYKIPLVEIKKSEQLTEKQIKILTSYNTFKNELKISQCIDLISNDLVRLNKIIKVSNDLIKLLKESIKKENHPKKHENELVKTSDDLIKTNIKIKNREIILAKLKLIKDKNKIIQEFIES